ncbi:rhodanese-like domain-containing protein [Flavobacterium sp.]|jgi:rhodanese-related sulfurtransferase|uniref:rhodanese-like domain-containing protein n=1 Tax=Flavobacterium sp. TaxID=239 RepID=UPI0037BFD4FF
MRNLLKIGFLFLFIVFSSSTISAQNTKATIKKPTTQKVKSITKKEIFYVDVRTPAEFAQGSVKGAVNIPLDQIEKQLAKFKGKKNIVVFCRSGSRSSKAKAILEQNGIINVTNGGSWEDVIAKMKK